MLVLSVHGLAQVHEVGEGRLLGSLTCHLEGATEDTDQASDDFAQFHHSEDNGSGDLAQSDEKLFFIFD